MSTQTLRPSGTVSAGSWARTGGSTKHGVLADDADATYLKATDTTEAIFSLTSYTLASGERVKQVRTRVRARLDSGVITPSDINIRYRTTASAATAATHSLTSSSFQTFAGGWFVDLLAAGDQQAFLDGLRASMEYPPGFTPGPEFSELYVDLDVWARTAAPTVSSDPSGTIASTDAPTIESYTTAINDGTPSLYSRQVRVFRDAVYLAGGFDPETETDVEWEQTDTSLGSVSTDSGAPDELQVGAPLANGDTYRAYVRYGKNAVAGETLWSEWGNVEFTLNLTLPTAPTIAVEVDQPNGRQVVTVTTAAVTHDTVERIRVERTDDGGATWSTVRGGVLTDALAGSTAYEFDDYDAPRGTTLQYRARVTEGITASVSSMTSDWATSDVVAHPNDGRWWMYDVNQWTGARGGIRVATGPEITIEGDQGVFYPLGRDGEAVVVSGTTHGDDGAYTLRATGTDECDAVGIIARYRGTVLVKDPFGEQKYIVWRNPRTRRLEGTPAVPRHVWDLEYVEVGSGIGSDG